MDKFPPKILKASLRVYMAYLLLMTLAPFRLRPLQMDHFPWPIGPFRTDSFDIVANVFLFLPFGFMAAFFPQKKNRFHAGLYVTLSAAGVSLAIETLQIVMHGRFPSFLDIFTNTLGGGIGFFIGNSRTYFYQTPPSIPPLSLGSNRRLFFRALLLLYAAFLLYLPFASGESFSGWNADVELRIGNNPEQTRPWKGEMLALAIYNQALTLDQIKKHYQEGYPSFMDNAIRHTPLALYTSEENFLADRSSIGPPHNFRIHRINPEQDEEAQDRLIFKGSTFLTSDKKGSKFYEQIRLIKQLTVEAWIHPQPQFDSGGRLVSFTQGDRTLWYLHQDREEIILGVRDTLFKRGYFHSEGIEEMLSRPPNPIHIVGVYDPERVSLAVNGRNVVEGFLTNGFFVLLNFFNLDRMDRGGRGLLSLALFWPLGLLLSLSVKSTSSSVAYGLLGVLFLTLLFVMCAYHPVLFFSLRAIGVSLGAYILGIISGERMRCWGWRTPPIPIDPPIRFG